MLICESVCFIDLFYFVMLDVFYVCVFLWYEQCESEVKCQVLSYLCYVLEVWFDEGVFVGFSGCWQFVGYGYIEYLVIDDMLCFCGYGKQLLVQILMCVLLIILEIDLLIMVIVYKWLCFYQLMGFYVNFWVYYYLSYYQGIVDYELLVLSYLQLIDEWQYQQFVWDFGYEVMGWEQFGLVYCFGYLIGGVVIFW